MEKTVVIDGMTCQHCVMHVKKALSGLKGVKDAEVEIGKAVLKLSEDVFDETIAQAIEDAGYSVK